MEGIGSVKKGMHPCQERLAKAHGQSKKEEQPAGPSELNGPPSAVPSATLHTVARHSAPRRQKLLLFSSSSLCYISIAVSITVCNGIDPLGS